MKHRDHRKLLSALAAEYVRHSPRSAELNARALKVLVDGGNHTIRLVQPFPPRIVSARGAFVTDEDGHRILDFWQGHHANILGHNPPEVTGELSRAFQSGLGPAERVHGRPAGARGGAALRANRLRAGEVHLQRIPGHDVCDAPGPSVTGRELVMKVGGGWHGAQPWGLVGVDFHTENSHSFGHAESTGLPAAVAEEVLVAGFNDVDQLERLFAEHGGKVACFIVEPFMGSSGSLPAHRRFLTRARELTRKHGAVLVFDEVISGFRFRAGSASSLYGVQPDLATFAKIVGGGMPVAAVAGRAEILRLAGRGGGVRFSGGTYSCHPSSMLASRLMMEHLVAQEGEIYPRIALLGEKARRGAEEAFRAQGLPARCTGDRGRLWAEAPWAPCISRSTPRPPATRRSRRATLSSATWSSPIPWCSSRSFWRTSS